MGRMALEDGRGMTHPPWSRFWKMALAPLILIGGAVAAWVIDRDSPESANRFHRGGHFQEAAQIYADWLAREPASAQARYNLGTALLGSWSEGADEALATVAASDADAALRARALNNLGLWRLNEAAKALGQRRARTHAVSAVEAYRAALRLQPGYVDAGWNLAIALRMLASIDAGDYIAGGEAVARPGDATPPDDEEAKDASEDESEPDRKSGEAETVASAADGAPLSPDQAADILGTSHRDPTAMVGKLVALEGRVLRERASRKTPPQAPR